MRKLQAVFPKLVRLDLRNNQFGLLSIKNCIDTFPKLVQLDLRGNPMVARQKRALSEFVWQRHTQCIVDELAVDERPGLFLPGCLQEALTERLDPNASQVVASYLPLVRTVNSQSARSLSVDTGG